MTITRIKKILIANRGEIACRIIRTARDMGIISVAIYSEVDINAPHVNMADEAYCVGAAPSSESYLDFEKIIRLTKDSRCDAIHPGYGFLSENADFAAACAKNQIIFIGPSEQAILAMGSKSAAKSIMEKAGVPILPGYHGDNQDPDFLLSEANKIGYPLLIKAVSGGGGKGMRVVTAAEAFIPALEGARREAKKSFSDDRVLLERYLTAPRHIEVQIMADSHGNIVHLFERDCSIQRRNQKIIEEAPAPNLTSDIREKLGKTGIDAARSIQYVGAGTIEFLFQDNEFYFMEMNTRLQVEHPITEKITGLDLVRMQINIASGEALDVKQNDIHIQGHAIEVRLYAENPDENYMPATGTITHYREPSTNQHVRMDSGIMQGNAVSVHYDPMLGKLITWGHDRDQAISLMNTALSDLELVGVINNINFLRRIIRCPAFPLVPYDTRFLDKHADLLQKESQIPAIIYAGAAVCHILNATAKSPWERQDSWRMNASRDFHFFYNSHAEGGFKHVHVSAVENHTDKDEKNTDDHRFSVRIDHEAPFSIRARTRVKHRQGQGQANSTVISSLTLASYPDFTDTCTLRIVQQNKTTSIFGFDQNYELSEFDPINFYNAKHEHEGNLSAPMPGTVVAVHTKPGDCVKQGQALMIIEAMKMEHTIYAPSSGIVEKVFYALNDRVNEGAQLIAFAEQSNQVT